MQLNDNPLSKYERLRRQIAENVHQSGSEEEAMNPIDTATGFRRLLEMMGMDFESKAALHSRPYAERGQEYIQKLADEVGITRQMIYDYLKLLEQPDFVINKVREGESFTPYLEADAAPWEHQLPLKKKIAEGELKGKNQVRDEVSRIKKLPELAEINLDKIDDSVKRIVTAVTRLGLALNDMPLENLSSEQQKLVAENLSWLMKKIMEYVGKNKQQEVITASD